MVSDENIARIMANNNKQQKSPPPLERSSYEFMAALLVATVTQLIPSWIAYMSFWIALAAVAVYFCLYSRGTVDYGPWRKFFLSACCIAFVSSMSYGQIKRRYEEENVIPPTIMYMTQWGATDSSRPLVVAGTPPHVFSGVPASSATVDGRLLDKYKKRFELMVVIFHTINNESYMDKEGICKSKLVKIRPEDLRIKVDFNTQFLEEIEMGATGQSYVLLAMPMGLKPEDFNTLNDAEDKGAQIIGKGSTTGNFVPMPSQR